MDNDSIKGNIIRRRTEEGISQDEMARRLDISRTSYRNIERGKSRIISRRLPDIARQLNISEEELVLGYKPSAGQARLEELKVKYNEDISVVKSKLEARIVELESSVAMRDSLIANLNELVRSKDEIISLLKRERK